jgi:hypothetical protein
LLFLQEIRVARTIITRTGESKLSFFILLFLVDKTQLFYNYHFSQFMKHHRNQIL